MPVPEGMRRDIGFGTATAAVAGEVIAVGIFLTPAGMITSIGSPFWGMIVWLAMGTMALCGAFCYGRLAARFPRAGGGYVYLTESDDVAPVRSLQGRGTHVRRQSEFTISRSSSVSTLMESSGTLTT